MKVTVQYFAQLGQLAGTRIEHVDTEPAATVQDLIRAAAARHGDEFARTVLDADGGLQPTVLLFVRDEQVRWGDPVALRDGDTVVLASPIAGGFDA